jgi:hypothetical protein
VVDVVEAGFPTTMLLPLRAETGMSPHTETPLFITRLAADAHVAPFQYCMVLPATVAASGTQTVTIPVATPTTWTSTYTGAVKPGVVDV